MSLRIVGPGVQRTLRIAARIAGQSLVDTLLPPLCPGCGNDLHSDRWLCADCRRALRPAPQQPLCIVCRAAQRPKGDREAGLTCHHPEHATLHGYAAYWMEDPLDAIVHAMKYEGRDDLARALARLVTGRVPAPRADGVTAVPLHRTRRRERGYNQAELLARACAVEWGIPSVPGLLQRARATRPQARLAEADRAANVAAAFQAAQHGWIHGRTWVLLDDVATTGSTLLAVAGVLREAGAEAVIPVVLALA